MFENMFQPTADSENCELMGFEGIIIQLFIGAISVASLFSFIKSQT